MTLKNHTLGTPKKNTWLPLHVKSCSYESSKHQANILSGTEHPSRFWGSLLPLLLRFSAKYAILVPNIPVWSGNIPPCQFPTQNSSGLAAQSTLPWRPSVKMDGNVERNEIIVVTYIYIYTFRFHIMVNQFHIMVNQQLWVIFKVARAYEQKLYQSCRFPKSTSML